MTAVEWLWNALLVSGFEEIKNVEGFYHLAKQKEKEQKESFYKIGYLDGESKVRNFNEDIYNKTFKSE